MNEEEKAETKTQVMLSLVCAYLVTRNTVLGSLLRSRLTRALRWPYYTCHAPIWDSGLIPWIRIPTEFPSLFVYPLWGREMRAVCYGTGRKVEVGLTSQVSRFDGCPVRTLDSHTLDRSDS